MAIFFLLLAAVTAGSNLIAIKYGLKDVSPTVLMFIRFGFSSVILAWLLKNKTDILNNNHKNLSAKFYKLDFKKLKKPFFISFYSSMALLFIALGIDKTTVSNTQAILVFLPIAVSIGAHYTFEEKHSLIKIISLIFGLCGTFIIIFLGDASLTFSTQNIYGNILIFLSTILSAIYLIKSKTLSKDFSPLELALTHSFATSILFLLIIIGTFIYNGAEIKPLNFTITSVLSLLYLIIFGTIINFYAYQKAIKLNTTFTVGLNSYIQIPVAVIGGVILFGDVISPNFIVGTLSIMLGSIIWLQKEKKLQQVGNTH
ncbi:DMT family transporter [candidate division WWE3 bacterium]|nr:DMT family transporter [candidate division WWE3 bacterium]